MIGKEIKNTGVENSFKNDVILQTCFETEARVTCKLVITFNNYCYLKAFFPPCYCQIDSESPQPMSKAKS